MVNDNQEYEPQRIEFPRALDLDGMGRLLRYISRQLHCPVHYIFQSKNLIDIVNGAGEVITKTRCSLSMDISVLAISHPNYSNAEIKLKDDNNSPNPEFFNGAVYGLRFYFTSGRPQRYCEDELRLVEDIRSSVLKFFNRRKGTRQ